MPADIAVVGHVGRDIVVRVDQLPPPGVGVPVPERLEMLGGKGANQAVALAQLGHHPALIGAVAGDPVGAWLLDAALCDAIDVTATAVRAGGRSSLIVSIVEPDGTWRYLEDLTAESVLEVDDIRRAAALIAGASAVSLQLQQGWEAVLEAAELAMQHGVTVFTDGAPPAGADADGLLELVDVLRADHREASILAGEPIEDTEAAVEAARSLLRRGPRMVAVATPRADVVAWKEAEAILTHDADGVVDTTGAGDAFMAGLISGLLATDEPAAAACVAASAAAQTVRRLGGRPALDPLDVWAEADRLSSRLPVY